MASRSRGGSSPLAWTTIFYLLLVFVAPLALVQTVRAEDEQAPLREDLGDGTFFTSSSFMTPGSLTKCDQLSASTWEPPILVSV